MTETTGARSRGLGGPLGSAAERRLVGALRAGDESTFAELVDAYAPAMLGVAAGYVPSREVAEEVVQDTWLALLQGLDRFEERSRLQTWLFRVLINIAKTRGARERRTMPFSALPVPVCADEHASLEPAGLPPDERPELPGPRHPPHPWWTDSPEQRALSAETWRGLNGALHQLPERQRAVVTLRDVLGCSAAEVCVLLEISRDNQRVLLHRGRARLRCAVERHEHAGENGP